MFNTIDNPADWKTATGNALSRLVNYSMIGCSNDNSY